jgi:uncharacterized protein
MNNKQSALNWFEIPSVNFDRAVQFYGDILGKPLHQEVSGGIPNGVFPYEGGDDSYAIGGAVIYDERVKPSMGGTTPYLNCNGKLSEVVGRVEAAGGKLLLPTTPTGFGSIAIIVDSEGNRVGLHSY